MQRLLLLSSTLAFALALGCYSPAPHGGVTPYPPGPIDMLSIVFGNDYSRLCPQSYDYCHAGKHSLCCPRGGCCADDAGRPTCCATRTYAADRYDRPPPREAPSDDGSPCGARATTCVRGGVTVCCAEDEGCCSDEQGLYCCSPRGGGHPGY